MSQPDFEPLAEEALGTFSTIADKAAKKLSEAVPTGHDSFAGGNTLTGSQPFQKLDEISKGEREGLQALAEEPAIARLLVKDEEDQQKIFYVSRKTNLPLTGDVQLASYDSPVGRLAALPIGEEGTVAVNDEQKTFYLVEKTIFHTRRDEGSWDSIDNEFRHETLGTFSIKSLRALLIFEGIDAGDELDQLLEQDEIASSIARGITHQVRTAMGLRDQPILDKFQDEIFRLPLNSQLMILGPPGTGKTTTLIKRLGQKLTRTNLESSEQKLIEADALGLPFESSWLMFTPSDLLKHYLKEAFSREKVPASDEHIKTWAAYRNDLARNSLGILKTPNGGKFTFKATLNNLVPMLLSDPRTWYEAFRLFHIQRLQMQFKEGVEIATAAATEANQALVEQLAEWMTSLTKRPLVDGYRDLSGLESTIRPALDAAKAVADELLKKERNRLFNRDREVFFQLAKFIDSLQPEEEEVDEDAEFDDDENEEEASSPTQGDIQKAVKAYLGCLRTLGRYKYRKKSLPKNTKSAKIRDWLGERVPTDEVLLDIGRSISFQNGLRRFVNAFKRYAFDVPTSYRLFRRAQVGNAEFYQQAPANQFHLCDTEVDAIVLLMLRNARELLAHSFVARELGSARLESLRNMSTLFRHQIMVDEATDFSVLQLACMESLTVLKTRSFFACGDFNQRITLNGVRSLEHLKWVSSAIKPENINVVYRQSRALNGFASLLLDLIQGEQDALGKLPEESTHEGVPPVLLENAMDVVSAANWIAKRISEVEQSVKKMPTIAVLVNDESQVKPTASALTIYLEDNSLKAVPCEEGKALGEGTDVRVFDIKHIKGLEFEAVFFVGVDELAKQKPTLFDRYLYVGATRAATYLGMACFGSLPEKMQHLRSEFVEKW